MIVFKFLNAAKGAGNFYEDRLFVHHALVEGLPEETSAIVATADLQGRERFQDATVQPIRLLGEALPERLVNEVLPKLEIDASEVGVLLAGDFYTVPALDKRGGTGDVTEVWRAFGDSFAWVAGVAGNHDVFGDQPTDRPRLSSNAYYLDGDVRVVGGISVGGVSGVIGNPSRNQRRLEQDYLETVELLIDEAVDVLVMHDGPDSVDPPQQGRTSVREILQARRRTLVVRGHCHWEQPLVELSNGTQVLNVDARVVVLTRAEDFPDTLPMD